MIADVFIKRPVTAIVVSVVLLLVGGLAIVSLPVSQYPDITPPVVQVTGIFSGAECSWIALCLRPALPLLGGSTVRCSEKKRG